MRIGNMNALRRRSPTVAAFADPVTVT